MTMNTLKRIEARLMETGASASGFPAYYEVANEFIPGEHLDLKEARKAHPRFKGKTTEDFYAYLVAMYKALGPTYHLFRFLQVKNADRLIAKIKAGAKVGVHWSTQRIDSNDPVLREGAILLGGIAKASSVDWLSTLWTNFRFPEEHEIWLKGPIVIAGIRDFATGKELWMNNKLRGQWRTK